MNVPHRKSRITCPGSWFLSLCTNCNIQILNSLSCSTSCTTCFICRGCSRPREFLIWNLLNEITLCWHNSRASHLWISDCLADSTRSSLLLGYDCFLRLFHCLIMHCSSILRRLNKSVSFNLLLNFSYLNLHLLWASQHVLLIFNCKAHRSNHFISPFGVFFLILKNFTKAILWMRSQFSKYCFCLFFIIVWILDCIF